MLDNSRTGESPLGRPLLRRVYAIGDRVKRNQAQKRDVLRFDANRIAIRDSSRPNRCLTRDVDRVDGVIVDQTGFAKMGGDKDAATFAHPIFDPFKRICVADFKVVNRFETGVQNIFASLGQKRAISAPLPRLW